MTLLHNKCQFARIFHWNVSGAIPVRPRSYTWLLILTDARMPVLIQTETPAAVTLEGTSAVLACVIATTVSGQTLIYI